MKNLLRNIKLTIGDKWPLVISLVCCVFLLIYAYGCHPETKSLIDPLQKVDRAELNAEIDTLLTRYESRIADLDKQEELRRFVFEQTLTVAQGAVPNPIGIVTGLIALLGVGATADDIRLRRQRAKTPYYQPVKADVG